MWVLYVLSKRRDEGAEAVTPVEETDIDEEPVPGSVLEEQFQPAPEEKEEPPTETVAAPVADEPSGNETEEDTEPALEGGDEPPAEGEAGAAEQAAGDEETIPAEGGKTVAEDLPQEDSGEKPDEGGESSPKEESAS